MTTETTPLVETVATKCDDFSIVLQELVGALSADACDRGETGKAVCKAGDDLKELCGGNDNSKACECLDKCVTTPLAAKVEIVAILHALPAHWHSPSVESKYALIERCDKAIEALA